MKRTAAKYLYPLTGIEPVRNGFVEYEADGTILRTGVSDDISAEPDYHDGALVPGFVNAHCHVELSHMRGVLHRGTGMAGFVDEINALRDTKPREEKVEEVRRWMDTMWRRGVSAMMDISNCDDSFGPKAESPMYTRTSLEVFGTEPEDCPTIMAGVMALKEEADRMGLDAAPGPHACYTMSPELLTAASLAGLESGFLSYHSEETPQEQEMMCGRGVLWDNRKASGMSTPPVTGKPSLVYFLDTLRKAHPAPLEEHILLVHEVCMTQASADALKATLRHPFVAVCPVSNLFIHDRLPPLYLMRDNGLTICLGTDSLSSNDDLDMVKEMFCIQENYDSLPLGEVLTWACRNGAAFLRKDGTLGTLEPGKRPGLVVIDRLSEDGRLTSASASRRII